MSDGMGASPIAYHPRLEASMGEQEIDYKSQVHILFCRITYIKDTKRLTQR